MKKIPGPRVRPEKRSKLTAGLRFCFATLTDRLGELGERLSDAEIELKLRELWEIHREAMLEYWYANEEPFTRPKIWWLVDAPAPQPQIVWVGGGAGPDPWAADRALQRAKELEILVGHGLLTDAERALLAKQPATLLPNELELHIDAESAAKEKEGLSVPLPQM